ncbi:hypothetical protein KW792_02150 [Candidatus Saccharibacteria bacterium]|nr:hypothetical protein [Candidatus Saccharibacteria bacterium]
MNTTNVLSRKEAVDTALQMLKDGTSLYTTLEFLRTNILPGGRGPGKQAKYVHEVRGTMLERVKMREINGDEAVCEYADYLVEVRGPFQKVGDAH